MSGPLVLSVVVPVRNEAGYLRKSLQAILTTDMPRQAYELVVVDDGSTDGSAAIAGRFADTVIRLAGRGWGPAYARNRAAELARGDVIAFVDPDVVVEPHTLPRMLDILAARPELHAVSATHASRSGAPNLMSKYWSLLLGFGSKRNVSATAAFGSHCGMIRRTALLSAGMYDEWRFKSACLEDVELGQRLKKSGHNVVLTGEHPVTHVKRWDLRSIFREVWNRSVLLSRSLGYERTLSSVPGEVVFTLTRAVIPAMALLTTVALTAAFIPRPSLSLRVLLCVAALVCANFRVLRFFARERGLFFAAAAVPVHLLTQSVGAAGLCVGWLMRDALGDPLPDAVTQAFAEVGVEKWPPVPRPL